MGGCGGMRGGEGRRQRGDLSRGRKFFFLHFSPEPPLLIPAALFTISGADADGQNNRRVVNSEGGPCEKLREGWGQLTHFAFWGGGRGRGSCNY